MTGLVPDDLAARPATADLSATDPPSSDPPAAPAGRGHRLLGGLRTLLRRPVLAVAVLVLLVVVVVGLFAPLLAPYPPDISDYSRVGRSPGGPNLLGTDAVGRDVLSRLMFGARTSLFAAVETVLVSVSLGAVLGILAGYLGGWVDAVLDRINSALMSVPPLILAIALLAALGKGLVKAMLAIGLVYATRIFRVARASAKEIRALTYIDAAEVIGAGPWRIAFRHVLPNAISPILVLVVLTFAAAIVAEAGLTYIGLGVPPPTASWGSMLHDASERMELTHLLYAPGIALLVTISALTVVGDALRDAYGRPGGTSDA